MAARTDHQAVGATEGLQDNLMYVAAQRPIARIHLATHADRLEDPSLAAAWTLYEKACLNHVGPICTWCGAHTLGLCPLCRDDHPAMIQGGVPVTIGTGHCEDCWDIGIGCCRICKDGPCLEIGWTASINPGEQTLMP